MYNKRSEEYQNSILRDEHCKIYVEWIAWSFTAEEDKVVELEVDTAVTGYVKPKKQV